MSKAFLATSFFSAGLDQAPDGTTHPETALDSAAALITAARQGVPAYSSVAGNATEQTVSNDIYREAPFLSKATYVNTFPLPERCWDGALPGTSFVHCSSGSTGAPTLWARSLHAELAVACTFERVFRHAFAAHERSTLAVILFPLGSWVGGMFTTICCNYLSMKGYKITLVTPGNKVEVVLKLVQPLGPRFDQTILLGYPPFVKGCIDAGAAAGLQWDALDIGIVLAGEVFSEEWRQLVAERAGIRSPSRRIVSLYGTADAGVIAAETDLSATIRTWLARHPQVASKLFKAPRLPTLCQYDPSNRLLDTLPQDGTLVVTCLVPPAVLPPEARSIEAAKLSGPPVLKYGIGDAGGIIAFADLLKFLKENGMDADATLAGDASAQTLPFVWVFGRSFWCVSLYGANVYVENIMVGLEQPLVAQHVTGKFVLFVEEDASLNKHLAMYVEVARGQRIDSDLEALVSLHVTAELCRINSEYANYVPVSEQAARVHLREYGDEEWFPVGVKHKYTM